MAEFMQGVILFNLVRHEDRRGHFQELFLETQINTVLSEKFEVAQTSLSISKRGVLRGLHYTCSNGQEQLVTCLRGEIFDVLVDLRRESPSFRQWKSYNLTGDNPQTLYVPFGIAHAFYVFSDEATVLYHSNRSYDPDDNQVLSWRDQAIGIDWPTATPILSPRDEYAPTISSGAKLPETQKWESQ